MNLPRPGGQEPRRHTRNAVLFVKHQRDAEEHGGGGVTMAELKD